MSRAIAWFKNRWAHGPADFVLGAGVCCAFLLSLVSLFGVCPADACRQAETYRFYGMDFGLFGAVFFTGLAVFHHFVKKAGKYATMAITARFALVTGCLGAEWTFVWVQRKAFGSLCPVCASIAAMVAVIFCCSAVSLFRTYKERFSMMPFFRKALAAVWLCSVAMFAFISGGLAGSLGTQAEAADPKNAFSLGVSGSPVTVYVVSDWLCPVCRKTEPEIVRIAQAAMKDASVVFYDFPVHPECANFSPYNLQFLTYEKEKYFQLRKALHDLAGTTKTPSRADVQKAVAPFGVTVREPDYAAIAGYMRLGYEFFRSAGLTGTPSAVVYNSKTRKHKVIDGAKDLNLATISRYISEVSR